MHLQKHQNNLLSLIHSSYTSSMSAKLMLLLGYLGSGKTEILPMIEFYLVEQGSLEDGQVFVVMDENGLDDFLTKASSSSPTSATKLLIINEPVELKNPSSIKLIIDLGISVILVSQADINNLNQAFKYKGDLSEQISADNLVDIVNLIIDYKLLAPSKVGYEYYTALDASKPLLMMDGNSVIIDQENVTTNKVRIRTI